ncbi:MAG: YlxM family DNA-binding protein [Clostridia bacterium]|nr:YlxM family DNA-binding protein [Clostridia bacterium]
MEKNVEISLLLSFYGNVLTDKQKEAVALYYNEDLSLAEISEIAGITRQGVRDNIKRAETVLYDLEEKLGLCDRFLKIREKLKEMSVLTENSDIPRDIHNKLNEIIETVVDINDNY